MLAFADAMRRSAAETSGLRSSNAEGKPGGIKGGAVERGRSETRNVEAGWPANRASAGSNCARWRVTAGNHALGVFNTVSARGHAATAHAPPTPRVAGDLWDLR